MALPNERFKRNAGFINLEQQLKLHEMSVAIAGVGGVGGRVATELVRMGITTLSLADPDIFTESNLNRQEGCYMSTLGKRKVDVIADLCRDINPEVIVHVYHEGVNEGNLDEFLNNADMLIEATDFMIPFLGVMLARAARTCGIPLIMGVEIGFGATVTWFKPVGYTYEQYFGLRKDVALEALKSGQASVKVRRFLPHVPSYGDLAVLSQVANGKTDAPAIAPAVGICAALISTHIITMITGKSLLPPAPSIYYFDAKEHRSKIIRRPTIHHYFSLATTMVNNALGKYDLMVFKK
jgi:molybdopterin/thiamine biosynthesis adenylyltransferase